MTTGGDTRRDARRGLVEVTLRAVGRTWPGTAVTILLGALWVGLTWWTGLTYHFLPPLIAAGGPLAVGYLRPEGGLRRGERVLLAAGGVGIVAEAWFLMSLGGFTPTATFVDGQPGGVLGEVVLFSALGAVAGSAYGLRIGRVSGVEGAVTAAGPKRRR